MAADGAAGSQMLPAHELPDFDDNGPDNWRSVRPAPIGLDFSNIFDTHTISKRHGIRTPWYLSCILKPVNQ